MKRIFIIIVVFVMFSACKTAEFGYHCPDVNGMIYDFENRPVPDYEVIIGKRKTTTDITGRFTLASMTAGKYEISGKKEGYESYHGSVLIGDEKQIVYIRVPSEKQLLDLADTAITQNKLDEASSLLKRASSTGIHSTDFAFYTAVVQYRRNDIDGAKKTLSELIASGVTDRYVAMFLNDLNRLDGGDEK